MFFDSVAYAMGSMGGGAEADGAQNSIITFVPLILILVIFYFLLYRPQQKRAREQKDLLSNLRRGDYVLCSGFYGRIIDIQDDIVTLEIDRGVQIRVNRAAVVGLAEAPTQRDKKDRDRDRAKDRDREEAKTQDEPENKDEPADHDDAKDKDSGK